MAVPERPHLVTRAWRRVRLPLLVSSLALAMVVTRVVFSSSVEWREAESLAQAGDALGAIDHYGRAARLYAPMNPFSSRAVVALRELAEKSQQAGDRNTALSGYRELRSAVLATRSFYTPHADALGDANQRIATLTAALEPATVDPQHDEAARARWHAERLAHDDAPSVKWSIVTLLGLCLFLAAAVGFFVRGLDDDDRLRGRAALLLATGIVAGLLVFLYGLSRA